MIRGLLRIAIVAILLWVVSTAALIGALRWVDPLTSAFMLEHRLAERAPVRYQWRPLTQIAPAAALAVIASEDQQFPMHHGFDVTSIQKAIDAHDEGRRLRGASTISQQTAKNLFLWSGRSFLRKGLEAWLTLCLETLLPKRRIMEIYLNVIELGDGIYGVEAAANRYFHKPASKLTPPEAALLAAVLPNPLRLHVLSPSRYVHERQDFILGQMRSLGGVAYLKRIGINPAR